MGKTSKMAGAVFVALLRGVNVDGNNIISMKSLKTSFEKLGFNDVGTTMIYTHVLKSRWPERYQPGRLAPDQSMLGFIRKYRKIFPLDAHHLEGELFCPNPGAGFI